MVDSQLFIISGFGKEAERACAGRTLKRVRKQQCLVLVRVTGPLYKSTVKIIFAVSTLFPDEVARHIAPTTAVSFSLSLSLSFFPFLPFLSFNKPAAYLIIGFSIATTIRKISRQALSKVFRLASENWLENRRKWTLIRMEERDKSISRQISRVLRASVWTWYVYRFQGFKRHVLLIENSPCNRERYT